MACFEAAHNIDLAYKNILVALNDDNYNGDVFLSESEFDKLHEYVKTLRVIREYLSDMQ